MTERSAGKPYASREQNGIHAALWIILAVVVVHSYYARIGVHPGYYAETLSPLHAKAELFVIVWIVLFWMFAGVVRLLRLLVPEMWLRSASFLIPRGAMLMSFALAWVVVMDPEHDTWSLSHFSLPFAIDQLKKPAQAAMAILAGTGAFLACRRWPRIAPTIFFVMPVLADWYFVHAAFGVYDYFYRAVTLATWVGSFASAPFTGGPKDITEARGLRSGSETKSRIC